LLADALQVIKRDRTMSEPIKLYRVANGELVTIHAPSEARAMLSSGEYSTELPVVEETPTEPTEETPTDGPIDPSPATGGGNRRRNRRDTQSAN
jgi:hypothetical protein